MLLLLAHVILGPGGGGGGVDQSKSAQRLGWRALQLISVTRFDKISPILLNFKVLI